MVNVYEYLGRAARKSNEVDSDVGLISDALILPGGFDERINVHLNGVKQVFQDININNSFILSSPRAGVLGINKYGVDQETGIYNIYNGENTYYETLTGWPGNSDYQSRFLKLFAMSYEWDEYREEGRQLGREHAEKYSWENAYQKWNDNIKKYS